MGFLDTLLGRSKPVRPDLDRLFALPTAAVTLEAATGLAPTGLGSVCFRAAEGAAFAQLQRDVRELLDADDGPKVELSTDTYGYTWMLARQSPDELAGLVTDLHAVNSTLEANGFGPHLLCSLAGFQGPDGQRLALVYLYKRGTFYPFAPLPGEKRDNALELQVRGAVGADLPFEDDLGRWFPVWGAPGL
ncbi:PspA-associated protein PspAB [Spirillospora sp. CA-294931]|uniref:PspA-associated protein PspAB n=1 Tax=Spirillospora sp. CA-294931 TaxID=3240042 RepID=UPI003D8B3B89